MSDTAQDCDFMLNSLSTRRTWTSPNLLEYISSRLSMGWSEARQPRQSPDTVYTGEIPRAYHSSLQLKLLKFHFLTHA